MKTLTFPAILSTLALTKSTDDTSLLPLPCSEDCATPYGEVLGETAGNIIAYSNCNAKCVIFDPHYNNGIYTGIQWQCVEFARRWLLNCQGVVYDDVELASDIWNKINLVTRVTDGKLFAVQSHSNGSTQPPQVGDLLIYDKAFFNTGHIAIVTYVDLETGIVRVAEQNFFNKQWLGDYAREIKLIKKNGRYWLWDVYLLGWKHVLSQVPT